MSKERRIGIVKLLLVSLLVFLVFTFYIAYLNPPSVLGSFNITISSDNRPFDGVYFILPFDVEGPIYRVDEINLVVKVDNHEFAVEPYILKEVNGKPLIFFVPVKGMGTYVLEGTFKISNSRVINYEDYPWEMMINEQSTYISIKIRKNIPNIIFLIIRNNSGIMIPMTLALIAILGIAYLFLTQVKYDLIAE